MPELVLPNDEFFRDYISGKDKEGVAKHLRISIATLRKLLNGIPVGPTTINTISQILEVPVSRLTKREAASEIPDDYSFFVKLRYGWWIHNDRPNAGRPQWFSETIKLTRSSKPFHRFRGNVVNQFGHSYRVSAERRNKNHFAMVARSSADQSDWEACLTMRRGHVLCGMWFGYPDHLLSTVSMYKYFLSSKRLGIDDLNLLARTFSMKCHGQADGFAPGAEEYILNRDRID